MQPRSIPNDEGLPLRLARLHWDLVPGDRRTLVVAGADAAELDDWLIGAGFAVEQVTSTGTSVTVGAVRERSLPDTVGRGMRLLICGLNPSLYAADRGVGFARPGNRFWPAAIDAGLVTRDRDPRHALTAHGVGMTDLVKRATARAHELTRAEYSTGFARVTRLVQRLRPGAVCMVGLDGWRAAVERRAGVGWQRAGIAGVPVYVMPSTSGVNARCSLADLAHHLRSALETGRGAPATAVSPARARPSKNGGKAPD